MTWPRPHRLAAVEGRLAAGDEQGRALQALYQDISHGRDELAPVEATCDRPDGEGWNAELAALYGRIEGANSAAASPGPKTGCGSIPGTPACC